MATIACLPCPWLVCSLFWIFRRFLASIFYGLTLVAALLVILVVNSQHFICVGGPCYETEWCVKIAMLECLFWDVLIHGQGVDNFLGELINRIVWEAMLLWSVSGVVVFDLFVSACCGYVPSWSRCYVKQGNICSLFRDCCHLTNSFMDK